MVKLLKGLLKGILYIIALPFFLLAILLYALYGIFLFLFMVIKMIVLFFTGRSLFEDLPEDKKAKALLKPQSATSSIGDAAEEPILEKEPEPEFDRDEISPQYIPPIYPSVFTPPYEEKETKTSEEQNEDDVEQPKENIEENDHIIDDFDDFAEPEGIDDIKVEPEIEETPHEEPEPIGRYEPRGSSMEDAYEEKDEKDNSGVKIERT